MSIEGAIGRVNVHTKDDKSNIEHDYLQIEFIVSSHPVRYRLVVVVRGHEHTRIAVGNRPGVFKDRS